MGQRSQLVVMKRGLYWVVPRLTVFKNGVYFKHESGVPKNQSLIITG